MKRILVLTVLAVLLISTVGATAAMATPTGNAAVRQFDVAIKCGNGGSCGTGKLIINPAQQTFVFNGHGGTPDQMYSLSIWFDDDTPGGVAIHLDSAAAKADGSIHMKGQCTATLEQLDEQSPRVFVGPQVGCGAYAVYPSIYGFSLENDGAFVAKIACDYSTDCGATWHTSKYSGPIYKGHEKLVDLSTLGVPNGAMVKMHAVVVAGKDKVSDEIFVYNNQETAYSYASYLITGTTLNNILWSV